MNLKKVSKIQQKYKDIVNGFVKENQSSLPTDNAYYNIVDLIKHMILLYYHNIFESRLLTDNEKDKLIKLLTENNKTIVNHEWELIFESAKDGMKRDTFIDKIYSKRNVILLIKLRNDTIIGGFTKAGWDKSKTKDEYGDGWSEDKDAFVFYLQSPEKYDPFIANIRQKDDLVDHALAYTRKNYGMFGHCWVFYFEDRQGDGKQRFILQHHHWEGGSIDSRRYGNYEAFGHGKKCLSGSWDDRNNPRENYEIEVFQISE